MTRTCDYQYKRKEINVQVGKPARAGLAQSPASRFAAFAG
jgi:hypothetical protein